VPVAAGCPACRSCRLPSGLNAIPNPAHRSRLGATPACVSTYGRELLDQRRSVSERPCGPSVPRRAMRQTDFCLLTFLRTSTRASLVPDIRRSACALRDSGIRLLHGRAIRFGGPRVACWAFLVPSRDSTNRTSDTLSRPSSCATRSRGPPINESRLDRAQAHPRETMRAETRSEMPSAIQGPSPRNTLSGARLRTSAGSRLCHRNPASRRLFCVCATLASCAHARSASTCPVAMGCTLLPTQVTLVDFCNLLPTHEHTLRAFRSSHASGALAPLHAGTKGCRLRWPKMRCRIESR